MDVEATLCAGCERAGDYKLNHETSSNRKKHVSKTKTRKETHWKETQQPSRKPGPEMNTVNNFFLQLFIKFYDNRYILSLSSHKL